MENGKKVIENAIRGRRSVVEHEECNTRLHAAVLTRLNSSQKEITYCSKEKVVRRKDSCLQIGHLGGEPGGGATVEE